LSNRTLRESGDNLLAELVVGPARVHQIDQARTEQLRRVEQPRCDVLGSLASRTRSQSFQSCTESGAVVPE